MPNLRSSRKRLRSSLKARARNKAIRSAVRTAMRKVRASQDPAAAQQRLREAMSVIDKSAKKGAIARNTGARYKSRLSRYVASLA